MGIKLNQKFCVILRILDTPCGYAIIKNMRNIDQRINIIIGQLEGVKKMLKQEDKTCFDSLVQLKAVKSGVASLMEKVMQEEFDNCFDKQCSNSKDNLKKIMVEILKK